MKIAVLFGGISSERNVSIRGGIAVCKALMEKGHTVLPIDPSLGKDGLINIENLDSPDTFPSFEELEKFEPAKLAECVFSPLFDGVEVAFLVLHGHYGEDGHIQSLLHLRGIPFTGSGIKSSSIAMDKVTSKLLMQVAGVNTPKWATIRPEHIGDFDFYKEIKGALGNKMVIKPNDQGSTIGLTIVLNGDLDELHQGILLAAQYTSKVLIEEYIEGREITVGIIDGKALPIVEIIPHDGFYDYENKYTKGKTDYVCPAELDEDLTNFIYNLAITTNNAVGCLGFSRIDFRIDEDLVPYCLEVNTIPGFTATSLVPMAAKEAGIDFAVLCEYIIKLAIRDFSQSTTQKIYHKKENENV